MPTVSEAKKHLRELILAAWEPYHLLGHAIYWSVGRLLLELYLGKATLSDMQRLARIFETQLGIKVIPEQEVTGP